MARGTGPHGGLADGYGDPGVDAETWHGAVLPGAAVGVRTSPGVFWFAGVRRGWTPPSTTDAIADDGTVLQLEAESAWNSEVGLHARHADAAGLDGAAFLLEFANQVGAPTEAGVAATDTLVNGDPTRHVGLELAPWLDLGALAGRDDHVRLGGSWTWTRARFVGGPLDDNVLPYVPEHLVRADLTVRLALGADAWLGVEHTSAQFADRENTVRPTPDGTTGRIPAWTTVDLGAGWRSSRERGPDLRVYSVVKNLADQPYVLSRAPAGIQPGGIRTVQVGLTVER